MKKILVLVLMLLVMGACTENAVTDQTPPPVNRPTEFVLGQTINFESGLVITAQSVRSDLGKDFFTPEEGNEFFYITIKIENKSSETFNSSSMLLFELRDQDGVSYNVAIFADTRGNLDGAVLSGDVLTGEVAFEIPEEFNGNLFLYFKPNIFSDPVKIKVK